MQRNRGRRRLRAAFVEAWQALSPERADRLAGAYLLTGTRSLLTAPFQDLVGDVAACLERVERLERSESAERTEAPIGTSC